MRSIAFGLAGLNTAVRGGLGDGEGMPLETAPEQSECGAASVQETLVEFLRGPP